jgi:hypothetical protein
MTEQSKAVMFSGIYRTGLTRESVGLYSRVVRTLLRCGKQGEGALANRVRENLGSNAWNDCISHLALWGVVEFEPARTGRARVVALTASGKQCAIECSDEASGDEQPQPAAQGAGGSLVK